MLLLFWPMWPQILPASLPEEDMQPVQELPVQPLVAVFPKPLQLVPPDQPAVGQQVFFQLYFSLVLIKLDIFGMLVV
jgi:hypothetical protein